MRTRTGAHRLCTVLSAHITCKWSHLNKAKAEKEELQWMSTISIFNRKYYCKFFVSLSRCLLFLLVFVKLLIASRVENYVGIINVLKYKSDKNANYCKSCEREDETNLFLKFATATGYWFVFFYSENKSIGNGGKCSDLHHCLIHSFFSFTSSLSMLF